MKFLRYRLLTVMLIGVVTSALSLLALVRLMASTAAQRRERGLDAITQQVERLVAAGPARAAQILREPASGSLIGMRGGFFAPSEQGDRLERVLLQSELPQAWRAPLVRVAPFGMSWTEWAQDARLAPDDFAERRGGTKGVQVDGMGPALRAAMHGLGVALAFDPLIESEIASGALVRVGPPVPTQGQIWFVCRSRERSLPTIRALRRWLVDEVAAMTAAV